MNHTDYGQMTAPCGMDCFNCQAYLAGEDADLRAAISARLGLSPEAAKCEGCRNAGGIIAFLGDREPCAVFRCTADEKISFCFECGGFPCDLLHPYADRASVRPHNTKLFNLCLIKKMGIDRWATEKARTVRETYFQGKLRVHAADKEKT